MARTRMLFNTARANSAATNHQKSRVTIWWLATACTMRSMMSLVIQRSNTGRSDEKRREMRPKITTDGPESQTIFKTAGTLRSAVMRSCHPDKKLLRSDTLAPTVSMNYVCQTDEFSGECPRSGKAYAFCTERPLQRCRKPDQGLSGRGIRHYSPRPQIRPYFAS